MQTNPPTHPHDGQQGQYQEALITRDHFENHSFPLCLRTRYLSPLPGWSSKKADNSADQYKPQGLEEGVPGHIIQKNKSEQL
jgi:hypothetical protein